MLDTSELSLKDYRFSSKTGNGARPRKNRNTVDALRTTCWFNELRIRTSAQSVYALEKQLEPESFGTDALGTSYRRNKWRWYSMGRHTPNPLLIRTIEVRYPGTQSIFDHVLWDVLRPSLSATTFAHVWLSRLSPNVATVIANPRSRTQQGGLRKGTLSKLEHISDLDTMACVIVFLRMAMEGQKNMVDASILSASLCRMAIVGAPFLYSHGVAGPLAEYFDAFLFSQMPQSELHEMRSPNYLERARLAAFYVACYEGDKNRPLSEAEKNAVTLGIFDGSYGKDIQTMITTSALQGNSPAIK